MWNPLNWILSLASLPLTFFLCDPQCHAEIGMLENVLGFRSVLGTLLAVIERNFPEHLRCNYNTSYFESDTGVGKDFEFILLPSASQVSCDCRNPEPVPHLQLFKHVQLSESVRKSAFLQGPRFWKETLPLIRIIGSLLRHSYGAPISRRRLYLFLFRKDILKQEAKSYAVLFEMMQKNLKRMHVEEKHQWHLAFYPMNR